MIVHIQYTEAPPGDYLGITYTSGQRQHLAGSSLGIVQEVTDASAYKAYYYMPWVVTQIKF